MSFLKSPTHCYSIATYFIVAEIQQAICLLPNGSEHKVIACYLGLYEEGEVEHINGSSLDLQLVGHQKQ